MQAKHAVTDFAEPASGDAASSIDANNKFTWRSEDNEKLMRCILMNRAAFEILESVAPELLDKYRPLVAGAIGVDEFLRHLAAIINLPGKDDSKIVVRPWPLKDLLIVWNEKDMQENKAANEIVESGSVISVEMLLEKLTQMEHTNAHLRAFVVSLRHELNHALLRLAGRGK